jgi:hypothetical protein
MIMTKEELLKSLAEDVPPELSSLLLSLWWDKKGNWDRAHRIAQDISSVDGSRVHAYLHRVEGDKWNANYWYNRAGMPYSSLTIEEEWENLVDEFLKE